jgi:hypothetical protein
MVTLPTWSGSSEFQYEGSVTKGTSIFWQERTRPRGWSKPSFVTAEHYRGLLSNFSGQEVTLGHYPYPPPGSVEEWLKEKYDQWGLTSYIGPILVREGYAERGAQRGRIRFVSNQSTPNPASQYSTRRSARVPDAPVSAVRPPLADAAGETRVASAQTLRSYFETADQQRRALDAVAGGRWLDPSGNLNLYEASWSAFDPSSSAFSAFQNFEKIYNELKQPGKLGWNVFRPSSPADCWPPRQIFETIKREFSEFAWRGPVNLLDFLNSGSGPRLESSLAKMQGIKRKQGYPTMAVSKFLHFYNPSLFPIYDNEVIWEKVFMGRFRNDFREFCRSANIPYERVIKEDTAAFLRYYMDWASSLLLVAHERFMQVFVEWLEKQPGVELRQRTFDAATLYATAFEFTAIGATAAS